MFLSSKERSNDPKVQAFERSISEMSNTETSPQRRGLFARLFSKGLCSASTSVRRLHAHGILGVQRPAWTPLSLRPSFLSFVIVVTLALIIVVEILFRISERNGGVLFAPDINELPLAHTFAYLYLPTLVAVLYSLLWNWIDLDIRRLEPFHQVSKKEGALAKDSLLLHYPFDFVAAVPLKSLKRRFVLCPISLT